MKSALRFVLIAICLSPGFRSRGAEENEAAKQLGLRAKARISQKTDREAIFHEIALSGGGRVYGLKFSFDLNPWGINFEALGEWIETFCVVDLICPPHLPRLRDVGDLAVLAITDGIPPSAFGCRIMFGAMLWEPGWLQEHLQSLAQQVGYAMFGCGEIYQVMLWDSPSLRGNLELLSRLPKPRLLLVVYTDQKDDEVLRLTRKTKIQGADVIIGDLTDRPNDARVIALSFSGVVVDRRGKPVPGCTLTVSGRRSKKCFCTLDADDHGKFQAICLPPVTYRLQAVTTRPSPGGHGDKAGKREVSASVDVKPGDENVRIVIDVADGSKKLNR